MRKSNEIMDGKAWSLIAALINTFFAVGAFSSGSTAFGVMCSAFALLCFFNFWRAH